MVAYIKIAGALNIFRYNWCFYNSGYIVANVTVGALEYVYQRIRYTVFGTEAYKHKEYIA
jgi:hypothetical protein